MFMCNEERIHIVRDPLANSAGADRSMQKYMEHINLEFTLRGIHRKMSGKVDSDKKRSTSSQKVEKMINSKPIREIERNLSGLTVEVISKVNCGKHASLVLSRLKNFRCIKIAKLFITSCIVSFIFGVVMAQSMNVSISTRGSILTVRVGVF